MGALGSGLAAQMQKFWNLGWGAWLCLVIGLLPLSSGCSDKPKGTPESDMGTAGTGGTGGQPDKTPPDDELKCQPGLTPCGLTCVDLQTESSNCGSCGTACTAPAVCAKGSCDVTCASDLQKCGDSCANLMTDAAHCGSCDKGCDAGVPCYGGVCGCPEGVLFCQGQCFDPSSDAAHCGSCGGKCTGGKGLHRRRLRVRAGRAAVWQRLLQLELRPALRQLRQGLRRRRNLRRHQVHFQHGSLPGGPYALR